MPNNSRQKHLGDLESLKALKPYVLKVFSQKSKNISGLSAETFLKGEGLPTSGLFLALAIEAGFQAEGTHSIQSKKTDVDLKCKAELKQPAIGYGQEPYGSSPYGRFRGTSNGKSSVKRRVTRTGQFSYRGQLYNLGRKSAGNIVVLVEQEDRLFINIPSRGLVNLALKP